MFDKLLSSDYKLFCLDSIHIIFIVYLKEYYIVKVKYVYNAKNNSIMEKIFNIIIFFKFKFKNMLDLFLIGCLVMFDRLAVFNIIFTILLVNFLCVISCLWKRKLFKSLQLTVSAGRDTLHDSVLKS